MLITKNENLNGEMYGQRIECKNKNLDEKIKEKRKSQILDLVHYVLQALLFLQQKKGHIVCTKFCLKIFSDFIIVYFIKAEIGYTLSDQKISSKDCSVRTSKTHLQFKQEESVTYSNHQNGSSERL